MGKKNKLEELKNLVNKIQDRVNSMCEKKADELGKSIDDLFPSKKEKDVAESDEKGEIDPSTVVFSTVEEPNPPVLCPSTRKGTQAFDRNNIPGTDKPFWDAHPYLTTAMVLTPFLAGPLYQLAKGLFSKKNKKSKDEGVEDSDFDSYIDAVKTDISESDEKSKSADNDKGILTQIKDKAVDTAKDVGKWISDNPKTTIGIAAATPIVLCGASKLFKTDDDTDESTLTESDIDYDAEIDRVLSKRLLKLTANEMGDPDIPFKQQLQIAGREIDDAMKKKTSELTGTAATIGAVTLIPFLHSLTKDMWTKYPQMKAISPKNESMLGNSMVTTPIGAALGSIVGGPVGAIGGAALANSMSNAVLKSQHDTKDPKGETEFKGNGYVAPIIGATIGSLIGGPVGGIGGSAIGALIGSGAENLYNKFTDKAVKNAKKETLSQYRVKDVGADWDTPDPDAWELNADKTFKLDKNGKKIRKRDASGHLKPLKRKMILVPADESTANESLLPMLGSLGGMAAGIAGAAPVTSLLGASGTTAEVIRGILPTVGSMVGGMIGSELDKKDKEEEIESVANPDQKISMNKVNEEYKNNDISSPIVNILIKRDKMSKEEATELYDDTIRTVKSMIGDGKYDEAEDYFTSELKLEPDYLYDELI